MFVGLASIYYEVPELIVAGGFLLAGMGYFWMISRAWKVMRFLSHSICRRRGRGERRQGPNPAYAGPERRSGLDRREQALAARSGDDRTPSPGESLPPAPTPARSRYPQSTRSSTGSLTGTVPDHCQATVVQ